ncbi:MAG: hypothetical protein GFH27_549431n36 [Chloroflexi bacterium AL-W]|nr:hypothetical protein [Chloroflexi bacterium AL-N1]NOK71640.1 hypothetical protein [Chloroflexi bacterium AL-N10]NOK78940.1 hypothetical protein [Chloroflexi bacterium AL-N5]NOK86415.1 hypothetical protein [Chloroflexi bacterium AL-W]
MTEFEKPSPYPDQPSPARMYDYYLGGSHNFEIDRQAADRVIAFFPNMRYAARANRTFLQRAVTFVTEEGVDQFLDLGAGIPTEGSVHKTAHAKNPRARIIHVDIDPVAIAESQRILADMPGVTPMVANVSEPDTILNHSETQRLLDFKRPVAVLMVALLHFVTNDHELYRIIQTFREAIPSGSYMIITHVSYIEGITSDPTVDQVESVYAKATQGFKIRTRDQVVKCFEGLEVVEPGIVDTVHWRADSTAEKPDLSYFLAGVARKP